MKATFKGILTGVKQLEQYGTTKIARLEIQEPPRFDQFGEQIAEGQTHQIAAINRSIEKLPQVIQDAIIENAIKVDNGNKVEATIYINSRTFEHEGKIRYSTELALADIKFLS